MKYEQVSVSKLIPYARNAKKHSDDQVTQIASSIREFGFLNPVIIDKTHGIIAGHGRVLAAQKLGLETVPCVRVEHLTEAQKKAYILADNKLALNSSWDTELLHLEIQELSELNFDVSLIGFNDVELEALTMPAFEPDLPPEDEPERKPTSYILRVEFENNEERELLFCELRDRGLKVKV